MLTEDIEKNINKDTKAIMPVHIYGLPVDMNPLLELASKYNLLVIEDAAEMHGQTYYGKPCGSFGDISVFSFYANKIVTTGEGGMIVCDDEELAEKCRFYRNLCFEKERRFLHNELGYNYRFTNVQAAIGLAQLEQIDEFIKIKRNIGLKYNQYFENNRYLQIPVNCSNAASNIYWVYPLVLKKEFGMDAAGVMSLLNQSGIATRPFFYPLHLQPVLQKMNVVEKGLSFPNSEFIAERGFYIPSGTTLTEEELLFIADKVNKIVA